MIDIFKNATIDLHIEHTLHFKRKFVSSSNELEHIVVLLC